MTMRGTSTIETTGTMVIEETDGMEVVGRRGIIIDHVLHIGKERGRGRHIGPRHHGTQRTTTGEATIARLRGERTIGPVVGTATLGSNETTLGGESPAIIGGGTQTTSPIGGVDLHGIVELRDFRNSLFSEWV